MSKANTAEQAASFSPAAARELRASLGYTQQQMADALLLGDKSRWSEYERGVKAPSTQTWALALIVAGRHPLYALREGAAHSSPSSQSNQPDHLTRQPAA